MLFLYPGQKCYRTKYRVEPIEKYINASVFRLFFFM